MSAWHWASLLVAGFLLGRLELDKASSGAFELPSLDSQVTELTLGPKP